MATQQILDELRPKMCPIDWNFGDIIEMFKIFLPVKLSPDLHNQGFKFVYFLSLSSSCVCLQIMVLRVFLYMGKYIQSNRV
jgi:hypothetical protein